MKKILLFTSLTFIFSCSTGDESYTEYLQQDEYEKKNETEFLTNTFDVPDTIQSFNMINSTQQVYEGEFIHVNDNGEGKIVWVFQNKLRHIESILTWQKGGLFKHPKSIKEYYSSWNQAISHTNRFRGEPIVQDNGLLRSTEDGRIFLIIGNKMHYINDPQTFNQYQLNWNVIRNVSYIRDYREGLSLYPSHYKTSENKTYINGGTLNW